MNILLGIIVPLIRRLAIGAILRRIASTLAHPSISRNGPVDPSTNASDTPVAADRTEGLPQSPDKERR